MVNRILVINGSYRNGGITDQAIDSMVQAVVNSGAEVEMIRLRERPIEFCLNCRECTQKEGIAPGQCVHHDEMGVFIDKIEQADGYILASPTNLGSVTAIFKRFMERLAVYSYWPWGKAYPVYRKANLPKKRAILISSCAAPGFIGRWLFGTHKQLKMTAEIIGAEPVDTLFTGLISSAELPEKSRKRASSMARKLI